MPRRLHHRQREGIVKDHREEFNQIQVVQRRFGDHQHHILVQQVVIADVFAQRVKAALAEHLHPAAQKSVVIRRLVVEHADPRQHRQRDHRAAQQQRAALGLLQPRDKRHRAARDQRKQRRKAQRLPPCARVFQPRAHINRQSGKQHQRHKAACDSRAPVLFHPSFFPLM